MKKRASPLLPAFIGGLPWLAYEFELKHWQRIGAGLLDTLAAADRLGLVPARRAGASVRFRQRAAANSRSRAGTSAALIINYVVLPPQLARFQSAATGSCPCATRPRAGLAAGNRPAILAASLACFFCSAYPIG